jgi:hypothetical protein
MNKNNKFYVKKPFKQRAINFAHSLVFWRGRKKGMIHTRNIEWEDIRYIFAPKNFEEKYGYLGCVPYDENSKIFRAMLPLVLAMDYEAKPKWCPRWFLRFLDVFGNDRSIVRVRNHKLHNLHRKLTKGIRLNDYKTKWQWYDLRISISAPKYLQNLADDIESGFYNRGETEEKEAQKLMNKHYIESIKKENEQ